MLARVTTFTLQGVEAQRVTVEVLVSRGLPTFTVVGLGDRAVRESRERVRAAVVQSGFLFPESKVLVNLAPASMRKEGPGFDLAIACGVLMASGQLDPEAGQDAAVFGELALSAHLRPCRGTLAVAEAAHAGGFRALAVPEAVAREAALVEALDVLPARDLREVAGLLEGETLPRTLPDPATPAVIASAAVDLRDVRGHAAPLLALEVAAAGGHNLLLIGPPGTGKTMLARRLPSILPPLSRAEAIEVTRIHSVAGRHRGDGLVAERPFRAPHHTISSSGLVGGGSLPVPGEASLAHHGVLFLDELAEFNRPALEALRQPLEDGRVAIVRGQRSAVFPTRVMLVASSNPCPCGYAGSARCRCSDGDIARYRRRLSGPLLDRMDLAITVERPSPEELAADPLTTSRAVRERVVDARDRQLARLADTGAVCNAHLDAGALAHVSALSSDGSRTLRRAYERGSLSPRGHARVLRVARTIADLDGAAGVEAPHLVTALSLRRLLEAPQDAAAEQAG